MENKTKINLFSMDLMLRNLKHILFNHFYYKQNSKTNAVPSMTI